MVVTAMLVGELVVALSFWWLKQQQHEEATVVLPLL
jgi:hypothetical protein